VGRADERLLPEKRGAHFSSTLILCSKPAFLSLGAIGADAWK
jgi:hypothetical protein